MVSIDGRERPVCSLLRCMYRFRNMSDGLTAALLLVNAPLVVASVFGSKTIAELWKLTRPQLPTVSPRVLVGLEARYKARRGLASTLIVVCSVVAVVLLAVWITALFPLPAAEDVDALGLAALVSVAAWILTLGYFVVRLSRFAHFENQVLEALGR